jgi:hypothetical protein
MAPAAQADGPGPHWRAKGCAHGHASKASYKQTTKLLKNHVPLTRQRGQRVQHFRACVATKAKARAVARHIRKLRAWRQSYAHRWPIEFNRLPAGDRAWAVSTSSCESGMNPATNTGNGFFGGFQFMLSTWAAAGGTGNPAQHSWHYQAVIAVRWMHTAGAGQWPVCG